jgi:hypothetical protein
MLWSQGELVAHNVLCCMMHSSVGSSWEWLECRTLQLSGFGSLECRIFALNSTLMFEAPLSVAPECCCVEVSKVQYPAPAGSHGGQRKVRCCSLL